MEVKPIQKPIVFKNGIRRLKDEQYIILTRNPEVSQRPRRIRKNKKDTVIIDVTPLVQSIKDNSNHLYIKG